MKYKNKSWVVLTTKYQVNNWSQHLQGKSKYSVSIATDDLDEFELWKADHHSFVGYSRVVELL